MNATPGPILPKICDWMLNKNYDEMIGPTGTVGLHVTSTHREAAVGR